MRNFNFGFCKASRMRTSISTSCATSSNGWGLKSAPAAATTFSGGTASGKLINLQREGSKAKVYQVRQVRQVVVRYGLEGEKE
jgi:hypothetical protein